MLKRSEGRWEVPAAELHILSGLLAGVSRTQSASEVYELGLHSICEIFKPDRASTSVGDSAVPLTDPPHVPGSGWQNDLSIPIPIEGAVASYFSLHYNHPRRFTESDLEIARLIALTCGAFIGHLQKQDELSRTAEAAQDALRSRDEMIAMAAHELRAPLTAIIGAVHVLRSHRSDPERAIEIIARNAQFQTKLIEDLLNTSRIHTGHAQGMELEAAETDLAIVLDRVIQDLQPEAAAARTSIEKHFDGSCHVRGDVQRLSQIFSNLLSNSIRCAPEGRIDVTATTGTGSIEVTIRDNGIGIASSQLPHIFERFRQADSPNREGHHGLGLGLAIVKELVSLHGGSIRAESDGHGRGATFIVSLPKPG